MKHTILSLAIAAMFASCSNNKPADQSSTTPAINSADTIGLSDYKEWKETQETQNRQTYTSPGVNETAPPVAEAAPPAEAKPKTIVIYRDAPAQHSHTAKAASPASPPVYREPAPAPQTENPQVARVPVPESSGSKREPYGRGTTGTEGNGGNGQSTSNDGSGDVGVNNSPAPVDAPVKKDGGWSKAAKDGAIGGASGAVIGAIFSKNKTKGAVIGGVVGAAGGYIFGHSKDKKEPKN